VGVPPPPHLQKELSGITLPWDLARVNDQQELEEPSAHNNSPLAGSSRSLVSHTSRFSKEDYMDDDELEDYIQRLESQPQSTHNFVNFLEEQQAAMKAMEQKNSKAQATSMPGAIAVQEDGKDELMERLTRKIQQEFPNLLKEDDDDEEEFSRVGPLPAHQTPRKSGRSFGLAERENSDSHFQPSQTSSPVSSPCATPSIGNTLLSNTTSTSTHLVLKCGKCRQPSDCRWLACDNLESPHLFCKNCVCKYLTQAPVTGAPLMLPDETNHLCRVPCFHKKEPCRGVVHVNVATVLSFKQMEKFMEEFIS
jgi:hypothetical protein